jgi:hypothetical protein
MNKFITMLLILISIQGFSQVKEINSDAFKKINWDKSLAYYGHGNFVNFRSCRVPWIQNEFQNIEFDTITNKYLSQGRSFTA